MIQLLYLAIIFDVMALTAKAFRRTLGARPSTAANLQSIREVMLDNIHNSESQYDTDAFHTMTVILRAIVLEIEPTPIMVEDPAYQIYVARRRRGVLESPPPTHADITPSKYVRYNPNYDPDANSPVPDSTASASSSNAHSCPVVCLRHYPVSCHVFTPRPSRKICCSNREYASDIHETHSSLRSWLLHQRYLRHKRPL
jgi:hypothetical protein